MTFVGAYAIEDGAQITTVVPSLQGEPAAVFTLRRDGLVIKVSLDGTAADWRLLLIGERVESADRGSVDHGADGASVTPAVGVNQVSVTLAPSA